MKATVVNGMRRSGNEIRVVPSVLDRLLDTEPEVSSEPAASRAKSLGQLKQSVRRDLQSLFNTRQSHQTSSVGSELQSSLISYGLPDFSSASIVSTLDQNRIRHALKEAVARFEPRLQDVVVTLLPAPETERALHFRIDARLRVEPAPAAVTFDTVLHIHSGEYEIRAI